MGKLPVPSPVWNQYVEQKKHIESGVSHIILDSWERSVQQNVNPYCISMNDLLEQHSLRERMESNRQLLDAASPVMLELHNVFKGGNFVVLLADTQGYILHSVGDPGFEEKVRKIRLAVGANWNESVKGTNAIGTALASQSCVNVFAWEHYCRENHFLTCSAAPIYGSQGELAGVLNVSSDYRSHEPHLLGSVVAAVRAIENRLLLENSQKQLVSAYLQMSSLLDVIPEGLLLVDPEGYITRINKTGSTLLGISPQECIGRPLENIFDRANHWLGELKHNKGILDRTATIEKSAGNQQTFMVKMTSGDKQYFKGVIASIRKVGTKAYSALPGSQLKRSFYSFSDIVGNSSPILETKRLSGIAARNNSTVLLQGESGTGKEMFAQAIHNASSRALGPFIAVNCGAIPTNLLESELFGYEEGAFTGAKKGGQPGKFELARGGTIFLDEIGEMPLNFQVTLLRILQEKQVIRIGGTTPIPLDVRIIAATNKDLEKEVKQGNFRLDLYYRLNVLTIDIPTLRDRKEDIVMLAHHFLNNLVLESNRNKLTIAPDLQEWLENYNWPGNVRELENIMERAVNFSENNVLDCEDLPPSLRNNAPVSHSVCKNGDSTLKDKEYQAIHETLSKTGGNITHAAKMLGIGRNTLHRKIKKYSDSL
ncbi:sigma-54-dependent Fis family transcriptional regulator [Dehalobacter sp. DCM]|uniref:sigma-54-dependent Fis family transcriptional regulator n=1 Tax=Dehalobacter sp. DCM TaxID=2907827 RepID=UPI003081B4BD|nr:sigma-54-dependent Fis family transcriptional regulator [Dehalobacter sp. DCM]